MRTPPRPPQTIRFPRSVPLSRARGATPARVAICLWLSAPSSGNSPSRTALTIGPMPGTLCRRSLLACHTGLASIRAASSPVTSSSWRSSHRMCCRIPRCKGRGAKPRRFFSATSISSSCRRRVSSASSSCAASEGKGRGVGRTRSANSARIAASRASVFASCPVLRAKSRTWRGLATTIGRPTAAQAATAGRSNPPVASQTMSVGVSARSRATRSATPASSFAVCQDSPLGRSATSSVALATSRPTYTNSLLIGAPGRCRLVATRPCKMRARGPVNCSGLRRATVMGDAPANERSRRP